MALSHMMNLYPHKKGTVPVCDTNSVTMLHNRKLLHVASTNEKLNIHTYIYIYTHTHTHIYIYIHMAHHIYKYIIQSIPFIMSLSSCHRMFWEMQAFSVTKLSCSGT